MKKLIFTFLISITLFSYGQAPQEISYQGVARNVSGSLLANQNIGIKLDLHQGSAGGAVVFSETHSKTTNSFGLFNLGIGSVNTAAFTAINWANGPYFMEVSMDPAGGSSYTSVGTQQFMSVPYALYAKTAGNATPTPTITINAPNTITSSGGSYAINIPAGTTYSAGTGINLSGNIISNTAPDQTVTITPAGSASVTGSYPNFTISTPTSQAYIAGNGIDISGGVISNTAAAVTPTILGSGATSVNGIYPNLTINTPTVAPDQVVTLLGTNAATVTGTYPNFTVDVPTGTPLPAGLNGQFLFNNNTIWDTLPRNNLFFNGTDFGIGTISPQATFHVVGAGRFDASMSTPQIYTDNIKITGGTSGQVLTSDAIGNGTWQNLPSNSTTVTGTGIAAVTPTTGNVFNVDVPQPSLNYNNTSNVLTLTQGSAVTTASLTGTGSSTISMTGAGIANVSPTAGSAFTVTVPNPTITIASGSLSISNGNSVAIPSPSLTVNSNSLTINGPGGNTVVLPSAVSQTLSVSGNSLSISGGNTVPLPPSPITGTGTGIATATTSVNNFTVNVPTQTLTVTSNSVITSNLGGTATIIPAVLSYTAGTNTLKLTDGLSVNTVTLNSSSTTSLTPGANVTVLGTAPSYTVSAPAYSISIPGGNVVQITNGPSTSTAAINATSLTLNGTNNNILSAGGNTVALNTYTSGTGITMTGTAPNYTLSSPSQTLGITGNSLSISGANTVILPPSVITGTGTGIATVTTSVNNFTVNVPSPTYTPANGVLSFGGTNTVVVSPTLSLTGTTLTSGAPTNSVNLSSLSVWSNSVGVLYPTTLTNSVGIGTTGPLTDKMEIKYASSPMNAHLHLKQMGTDSSSRIKFSNTGAPSKFWLNAIGSVANDMNSGYNFYYHNGTIGRSLFTVVGNGKVSVNIGSAPYPTLLEVNGGFELDSTIAVNGLNAMPPPSLLNSGKIYFDRANQRFKVSQNGGAYVDLLGGGAPSPWLQAPGRVTLNNLTDSVGIGTSGPLARLHIEGANELLRLKGSVNNVTMVRFYGPANPLMDFTTLTATGAHMTLYDQAGTYATRIGSGGDSYFRFGKFGLGTDIPSEKLDVRGNVKLDSSLIVQALNLMPPPSLVGNGRIYFDQGSGKFKVSENGLSYVNLVGGSPSPWIQGPGIITQNFIGDKVGIGTPSPNAMLDIQNAGIFGGIQLSMNPSNTSNALNVLHNGLGNLAYFQINNTGSSGKTIEAYNNGNSNVIHAIHTGSTTGAAGFFQINNVNSNGVAVDAISNGNNAAVRGFAGGLGEAGNFNINNPASNSSALFAGSNANTFSIRAINTGSTSGAAYFNISNAMNSNNTIEVYNGARGTSIFATNTSSTNATANLGNTGTGMALYAHNTSNTDPAVYIINNGSYQGLAVTSTSGTAVYASNTNPSNASIISQVSNVGTGTSLYASNSNTTSGSAAQFDGNSGSYALNAINYSTGGAINASSTSGTALYASATNGQAITAVSNSTSFPTAFVNNTGSTSGLQVDAAQGMAIKAYNNSGINATIDALNNGTGISISAVKGSTTTGGNVARFVNNSLTNSADAVFVKTDGTGAAIRAVNGPTVTGSSNAALWLENGHMKATGTLVSVGTTTVLGGFSAILSPTIVANSNDIKGAFSFNTGATGFSATNYAEIEIKFSKSYSSSPTVNLTPTTDLQGLDYLVSNVTLTSFFVRIYRSANSTTPASVAGSPLFKFNYMVIE